MKTIVCCAVVLLAALVASAVPSVAVATETPRGGWVWQNPLLQGNDLNDVCMIDAAHGWAAGAGGAMLETKDGGVTWAARDCDLDTAGSVFFLDELNGWATGVQRYKRWGSWWDRHVVLRTTDGGVTWTRQDLGEDAEDEGLRIRFVDPQCGWAIGNRQLQGEDGYSLTPVVLSTTDGGLTWSPQDLDPPDGLVIRSGTFLDRSHGWLIGSMPADDGWPQSVLLATTDGGATWSTRRLVPPSGPDYFDITFVDADHGWVVGYDQRRGPASASILATDDGGATWHEQLSSVSGYFVLLSVAFADADHGWAVGEEWGKFDARGLVVATSDGGATWRVESVAPGQVALYDVAVPDADHCVAVGLAGSIVSTADSGSTWRLSGSAVPSRRACLLSVCCTDADHAWAVGRPSAYEEKALIVATSDAGATWAEQDVGADAADLVSVDFADQSHGWAVGEQGTILATVDGGESWTRQARTVAAGHLLWDVAFADDAHGWAVGEEGFIVHTEDGGTHWRAQRSGTRAYLDFVDAVDDRCAWATGTRYVDGSYTGRVLLHTMDGGATWASLSSRPRFNLDGIDFLSRRQGWAVTMDGAIVTTSDGGSHWVVRRRGGGVDESLTSVTFVDAEHGWAWGGDDTVLATVDGGWHWNRQGTGIGVVHRVVGLTFADAQRGWAVGFDGMIIATTDGGLPTSPDAVAPTTVARGQRPRGYKVGAWCNRPVTVALNGKDDSSGWGVATTWFTVDDAADPSSGVLAVVPAPADHSADGAHTITFHSVDLARNAEAPQVCTVSIDTRRPRVLAPIAARVVRGATASLGYRVVDRAPCAGTARVRIRVCDASGRLVKRLGYHDVPVNAAQSATFTCDLPRGRYSYTVTASDAAGNVQLAPAGNVLVVR